MLTVTVTVTGSLAQPEWCLQVPTSQADSESPHRISDPVRTVPVGGLSSLPLMNDSSSAGARACGRQAQPEWARGRVVRAEPGTNGTRLRANDLQEASALKPEPVRP